MTRLLVVTGSRSLDATLAAKTWALRELAARIFAGDVDVVVHGACRHSPDDWADHLAHSLPSWGTIAHVIRWPLPSSRVVDHCAEGAGPYKIVKGHFVRLRDHDRYPYTTPLERNAAMIRWAADQRDAGHVVRVLGLRTPWATTGGTAATLRHAQRAGLDVVELVCPPECGPTEGR